jgi:protein-disulfide isomerase
MTSDLTSAPAGPLRPDDHVRGPAVAPLVIVYADFTCPVCAVAAARLASAHVRVCFRHFALATRHPRAVPVAAAAEAAARQDAFWAFHDALYADQGRIDDPHLWSRAAALGLDVGRLDADRRDPAVLEQITRDTREALRAGGATTPALILPGGRLHQGAPEPAMLARLRDPPPAACG